MAGATVYLVLASRLNQSFGWLVTRLVREPGLIFLIPVSWCGRADGEKWLSFWRSSSNPRLGIIWTKTRDYRMTS